MSKLFNSVVHNTPPKRVNDFVPVKPRKQPPAEKAAPRFVDIFEHAQKTFALKIEKKYNTASANKPRVFRSILTREKSTSKV